MAFFDKLNDLAKNIGDKTKDAIEIGKLTTKINSEKSAITEEQRKIGEYYYTKYTAGGQLDNEVLEFCTSIDEHKKAIAEAQSEIESIKAVSEAANANVSAPVSNQDTAGTISCSSCGASNKKDTKFCKDCGNKLAPPAPASVYCTSCGVLNAPGTKFCSECGTKIE